MSRLKKRYKEEIKSALVETFGIKNAHQIPKLEKIVISMGLAEACRDKNLLQDHLTELGLIAGQKPVICRARKSVSNFKLREGMPIGAKVTLRGQMMYDFLDRFVNIVCPRIRDFRGLPVKCDGQGNYSVGLESQEMFPEINLDNVKRSQGMHLTMVTSAPNDEQCVELLRLLGVPFKDRQIVVAASAA